ncbi:transglycosylase domain-containing protein [Streptomyces buecherae]|uniref:transglycosylase domain-containing protein n=3 Tax=Streptomyces buecherae TaxID=2763006 RepID=UPI00164D4E80|nr:transglycosylase domain-containing protein [Streptomyces buecherae]QNJ41206.1 penicillin-binding protein [Streptomyces buecherae]
MSEHRRKPPQPQGGGRAAARRAAQQPPGRRAAPPPSSTGPGSDAYESPDAGAPRGGRAESRRAARGGGGRRRAGAAGAGAGAGAGASAAHGAAGAGGPGAPGGGAGGAGGGRRAAGAAGAGGGRGRGRGAGAAGRTKKRFIDYPRAGKRGFKRWMPSWKLVTGTCLVFFALLIGAVGIALMLVEVPTAQAASKTQKNVYYWADGKQMVVSGGGDLNRQIVPLSKIPKSMRNAVIAAENASFYDDAGVDPMGVARAVVNMAKGGQTQSGSTITQQFVKNTYLGQEQTLKRKVTELFISIKVGATKDKDDILEGYLNTAYYGRGAYGIQAAARAFYDKDCEDLTTSESAFLAATLNGPNLYDPAGGQGMAATKEKNRKRAEARWAWTLDREVKVGRLDSAEREKITKFPEPQKPKLATNKAGQIGYLTDLADNYIIANSDISKAELDRGGYQIHTTFDREKMKALEKTVNKVSKENIRPDKRPQDKHVQFGGASVEPGTGKIVAIYGGKNALEHYTNNADDTGVQVGSTFKPFVLAAAMTDGKRDPALPPEQSREQRTLVSPKSIYNGDNKVTLRDYKGEVWLDKDGKEWHQRNDGDESRGKIDLRTAMQFSVNTPFIQLGMDVGTDKVRDAALAAGLSKSQLASITPTFSLGTSSPSAIRLAGSYATFAASGKQADPYSVTKVERDGAEEYVHEEKIEQAFEPNVADNVTDVLKTVVEKGTGTSARIGREAAGKTGTTDDNKSAWFAGYTPQLSTAIGMWRVDDQAKNQKFLPMYGVGSDTGSESIHGASYPAKIWAGYMKEALKNEKKLTFPKPSPIGDKIYGDGASPPPTQTAPPTTEPPTEEPTEEPTTTPPTTPTKTPTTTPPTTPPTTPTDTCGPLDPTCGDDGGPGGGDPGGPGGGDPGGPGGPGGQGGPGGGSPSTTPTEDDNEHGWL